MAKDITLKNADGSVIYYPKTVSDLVYDNESGKTVKEDIASLNSNVGNNMMSVESDLDICDDKGNTLVRFNEGHIKTKNFDSKNILVPVNTKFTESDFEIKDDNDNVILSLQYGHIITKNFNSSKIDISDKVKIHKVWYACGDSTTYGAGSSTSNKSWANILSEMIDFDEFIKIAQSGACCKYYSSRGRLITQINSIPNNFDGIVTIMIGVNDYNLRNSLGDADTALSADFSTLNDEVDFASSFRYCLQTLKTKAPKATVLVMMPLQTTASGNGNLEDYREVERKICKALSVPVIETANECGISKLTNFIGVNMNDSLHPNDNGYQIIANYMYNKILTFNK